MSNSNFRLLNVRRSLLLQLRELAELGLLVAREKSSSLQFSSRSSHRQLKMPKDRCNPGIQTYIQNAGKKYAFLYCCTYVFKWDVKNYSTYDIVVIFCLLDVTITQCLKKCVVFTQAME